MTTSRPAPPPLDDHDVHVWVVDPRRPVNDADIALLAPEERERADRFRFERDRQCYMLTRVTTRRLLTEYLGARDPATLVFEYGARGKPYLERQAQTPPLFFNASHAGDRAAIAVTRAGDVGIDIEKSDRTVEHEPLAIRVFSDPELETFRAQPHDARARVFFDGWTRKEAVIKATGEGMWRSLQSVEVEIEPGATVRVLAVDGSAEAAADWTLAVFDPGPGYVGAVAVRARGVRVRLIDWPGGHARRHLPPHE